MISVCSFFSFSEIRRKDSSETEKLKELKAASDDMMNEKLKDKVVAIELAGNNILIANDNDNFKNELISIGFEKVEPYYSISMPTDDVEKRAVLFQKLIEIGTLFSNGKDWSPSEIVRYYRDKGLIRGDYLRIAWRNKQDFNITTE